MKKVKKKKRVIRRFDNDSAKLQVDRFFEVLRKNHKIYAFQHESPSRINFFLEIEFAFVVTRLPKRKFFVDSNILVDEGFQVEFYNLTREQYSILEQEVKRHFGDKFFYKFPKNDNRNAENKDLISGKILLKNFKKKNSEVINYGQV